MIDGRFRQVLRGEPVLTPPIWLMRQAGRYQASYQQLRTQHSFEALCRTPELSAEVALAPVRDFDFDAAILFSDLLFPLEALGFGLSYDDGPPRLDGRLDCDRLQRFRPREEAIERLTFQRDAMRATRSRLSGDKALIGFVGGPWTLFVYAMEGTHAGPLARAKAAMSLYRAFADRLVPLLVDNIRLQFDGGADLVMIFDTAAGELDPETFSTAVAPDLVHLADAFPRRLGYYAKGANVRTFLDRGPASPWAGVGLDSHWDLASVLRRGERPPCIQGNFEPIALQLTGEALDAAIETFVAPLRHLHPDERVGWICGLGHGVLPGTPESSVRLFVDRIRETFA